MSDPEPDRPAAAAHADAAELRRREAAAGFATGSIGLEGLRVAPAQAARRDRFVRGEISFDDFMQESLAAKFQ